MGAHVSQHEQFYKIISTPHSFSYSYVEKQIKLNNDIRNKFLSQYLVVEKIGEGQFGIVHKCKQLSTGNFVAVKRTKEKFEGAKDRF